MSGPSVSPVSGEKVAPALKSGDAALLASLGYKQEFKRAFHPIELFGIGFSIIGLVPSIASVLVYAIPNGGPVAMVWGVRVPLCYSAMTLILVCEKVGNNHTFPYIYRACARGTRQCCAYLWRPLLLDA